MESAVAPGVRSFWRQPGTTVWIVRVWAVRAGLLRCDFSLDVANPLSLILIFETWELDRLTASCDLNLSQLLDLAKDSPPERIEVV